MNTFEWLLYFGFLALGWYLRHKGIMKPLAPPSPTPLSDAAKSPLAPLVPLLGNPALAELLKHLADLLQNPPRPTDPVVHKVTPGNMVSSFVPKESSQ